MDIQHNIKTGFCNKTLLTPVLFLLAFSLMGNAWAAGQANNSNNLIQSLQEEDVVLHGRIDNIQLTPGPKGDTGTAGTNATDRTAELCALYHYLYDASLIGDLTIPTYCNLIGDIHYAIGDTGPAGGIVFYVDEVSMHGLEAAPADQQVGQWGCYGTEISGADGTAVGTGAQNTADIVAGCADPGTAARIADAYSLGGYDDWFLPSRDELNLLSQQKDVVGGFGATFNYWSSTEANIYGAWYQSISSSSPGTTYKSTPLNVRPVRAF